MIVFKSGGKTHTIGDHVKDWSFEELKEVFDGKLDYKALAKELGIKKTRKSKVFKKDEE